MLGDIVLGLRICIGRRGLPPVAVVVMRTTATVSEVLARLPCRLAHLVPDDPPGTLGFLPRLVDAGPDVTNERPGECPNVLSHAP